MAVGIRWTGLGTGLWDWTHRKLRSSFLKARKQEIAEQHYIAATVDNSLPSTRGVPTQLSPCRQPPWSYHAKPARLRFGANSSMTTSRNTWLANSRIPSGTTILQLLELFLCMLLPSLARGASVPAYRIQTAMRVRILGGTSRPVPGFSNVPQKCTIGFKGLTRCSHFRTQII